MKIIIFLEYLPPYQGSDRTIFELTKRIKGKNLQIFYMVIPPLRTLWEFNQLSLKSDRFKKFYYQSYFPKDNSIKKSHRIDRIQIPIWMLGFWKKHLKIAYILTFIHNLIKAIFIIRKINPNMVIINHPSPSSGLLAFLICKIFNKRFLMGFPDMISTYSNDLIGLTPTDFLGKMIKRIETFLLLRSPKIFTINQFLKDFLISMHYDGRNIAVIPNGVDIQIFNHNKKGIQIRNQYSLQNDFVIIYVGHIEKWAGVQQIISAAKILESLNPDIKYLFVGDGMLKQELENLANPKNIIFTGLQPYSKIPEFIACSNVAISIFPKSITSNAASPLKIFEYMAMGKPVISTYLSGLKNVLINDENGIIIPSNNPTIIADTILRLKNSAELSQKLGKNALKTIQQQYTWEKSTNELKKFFMDYVKELY